jgi:hypothetical protein
MIAVRPEVKDFVVGGSFDYSFVPEMCPSGNLATLTDSDEYLVVEMQPLDHESRNLLPGPIEVDEVAESLLEWATADHRRNVDCTIVYHAAPIPDALPRFDAEADAFVDRVRALLKREPHPHRHHHYWLGSLAVGRIHTRRQLSIGDLEFILGEPLPRGGLAGLVLRLRYAIFGSPPDVTRLHPRWPDYEFMRRVLSRTPAAGRLLLVTSRPANYARWLTGAAKTVESLDCDRLLNLPRSVRVSPLAEFDCCLMVLTEGQAASADKLIAAAVPLLGSGGSIVIVATSSTALAMTTLVPEGFAAHLAKLANSAQATAEVYYVPATPMRRAIYCAMERRARQGEASGWRSLLRTALLIVGVLPLAAVSCFSNLAARAVAGLPPAARPASSVFLILRPTQARLS